MSHIRLFEHPSNGLASPGAGMPILDVIGKFPDAKPGLSYEGRIQIINSVGDCTVEMLSGELPLGAVLSVDNTTKEVVVTWPEYAEEKVVLVNAGFEAGDVGWNKGAGWTIETSESYEGSYAAAFRGGGVASIESQPAPVTPGTTVNASCQIQQGGSSAGNVVARILLIWLDEDGHGLPGGEGISWVGGNLIRSGSNGAWKLSSVSGIAPLGAAKIKIACSGNRKKQNRPLYADNFQWDLMQPSVGTNVEGQWCISLRVRDSLGREADWEGCIKVNTNTGVWVVTNAHATINNRNNEIQISEDLVNWEVTTMTTNERIASTGTGLQSTGDGHGFFVAQNTGRIVYVNDIDARPVQTEIIEPGFSFATYQDFWTYDGGALIITGHGSYPNLYFTQDRGRTWQSYPWPGGSRSIIRLNSGRWVGGTFGDYPGGSHSYYTDNELPTGGWAHVNLPPPNTNFNVDLLIGDGTYALPLANTGRSYWSENGSSWIGLEPYFGIGDNRATILLEDVGVVLVGVSQTGGYVRVTNRGFDYVGLNIGVSQVIQGFSYGNGIVVAHCSSGALFKSFDHGLTFESITIPANQGRATIGFLGSIAPTASPGMWD